LIWNVRGIVNNHVETFIPEGHSKVVAYRGRPEFGINVKTNNGAATVAPESPHVDGRVQDSIRRSLGVEVKHSLKEFCVSSLPNRWDRLVAAFERDGSDVSSDTYHGTDSSYAWLATEVKGWRGSPNGGNLRSASVHFGPASASSLY
jgi:hypothetical protein